MSRIRKGSSTPIDPVRRRVPRRNKVIVMPGRRTEERYPFEGRLR